jgi:hypothetical protein
MAPCRYETPKLELPTLIVSTAENYVPRLEEIEKFESG